MNWCRGLKGKVRLNELLKRHTSFKIGGPAKFFIEPKDIDDLKLLLNLAKKHKIAVSVIGAGSNILANDKGINGIALCLSAPYFKRITFNKNYLEAASGIMLNQAILSAQSRGLGGMEFLSGIPGTLGGAIMMNAGAHQKNIGDLVENLTLMDYNGSLETWDKKRIKFGYRRSNLARYIILGARLKLSKRSKKEIKNRIKEYLDYRRTTQDLSRPSLGCIFKNPVHNSAGRLIDVCGLKGKSIGGACVSKKHANFILNQRNATSRDVLKLMNLIQKKVKQRFNITLRPEIKIWY